MDLLLHGNHEPLKRAVHRAGQGLCAVMCAYNASAFLYRGLSGRGWQKHLAVNAAVYGAGFVWEAKKADGHK